MITKQDLLNEREQMQEDMLCLLDCLDITVGKNGGKIEDRACQIVVDGINRLIKKTEKTEEE